MGSTRNITSEERGVPKIRKTKKSAANEIAAFHLKSHARWRLFSFPNMEWTYNADLVFKKKKKQNKNSTAT